MCGYLKLKFRDVGQEARELEGRREMEEKGILFVILSLFLMVHG